MKGGSDRQRTAPRRPPPSFVLCLVSTLLLLNSAGSMESPSPAWAAVYECRDATGTTVLTDRPRDLHNCKMLSKGKTSTLTPPDASPMPQMSPPPINSDQPSPHPYVPLPPTLPTDTEGSSIDSLSAPSPKSAASPSQSAPCVRGLNPLNPLSDPPCVQSDQSGTQPAGAAPAPSP
jgi:hypothetical protein